MPPVDWPQFALGMLLCLLGWTLYWVGLHLTGALVGGAGGLALAYLAVYLIELQAPTTWWVLAAGVGLGFVFGLILIRGLHKFFFFLMGSLIGLAIGQQSYNWAFEHTQWAATHPVVWQLIFGLGGAVLGGMLLLITSKWVVAALTSLGGALLAALSVQDPLALYGVLPLAAASFFWQAGLLRKFGRRRKEKEVIQYED